MFIAYFRCGYKIRTFVFVLPFEVVLFVVSVVLLDLGWWMKLILMGFFQCYFMFKALNCSTLVCLFVCLCIAFPFLSFQISAALLRFKTSRVERIPWFFLYFIFLLSHRLTGCFRFIF